MVTEIRELNANMDDILHEVEDEAKKLIKTRFASETVGKGT